MLNILLLVCCINQFSVTVEKPLQSFTVQVEKPSVAVDDSLYVVMFTASWCGPCSNYKQSGKLDKIVADGTRVVLVDIDSNKEYYQGRVPRFWLCRNKIRVHEFPEGAVEPEVIQQQVKKLTEPVKSNFSVYNGKSNSSHKNRESLIDHLMRGEVHRGKHRLSDLVRMSDIDLDKLHNSDHYTP